MARQSAKIARPKYEPDADEAEALAAAAATLSSFVRVDNPEAVACSVISKWIIERQKRAVGIRLSENLVFDLAEARMQGRIEAVLGAIAESLGASGFDFAKAFNDLSKEEAVALFVAGCIAWREAAVAAGENPDFPFDDAVPFGEAA